MISDKIALGSVQFGLNYGINNKQGQLSLDSVREILLMAYELGINTLDTAEGYGNSEEVIGFTNQNDFNIISKLPNLQSYNYGDVKKNYFNSLDRLKVEKLLRDMDPGCTLLSVQTFSALKKQGLSELERQLSHWLSAEDTDDSLQEPDLT